VLDAPDTFNSGMRVMAYKTPLVQTIDFLTVGFAVRYLWAWKGWDTLPLFASTSPIFGSPATARLIASLVAS